MPRLVRENYLAATAITFLVSSVAALLIAADTFQRFNATGELTLSPTTTIGVIGGGLSIGLLFLFLCDRNRRYATQEALKQKTNAAMMIETTLLPHTRTLALGASTVLIGAISLFFFLHNGPTAFEWPGTDMGPFFERQADPAFAEHDYFTNTSSLPNPRHVFGYAVVGLGTVFGTDWYTTYYLLKVVVVIFLPTLFFAALALALRRRITSDARYLTALLLITGGVLATFIDRINGIFSIGWWVPIDMVVRPQTISLLFGLSFIVLSLLQYKKLAVPLLAAATLIHPAIGLFIWAAHILLLLDFKYSTLRYYVVTATFGVGVPFLLLAWLFPTTSSFSGAEFVYHYVIENHAFHYLPSQLGNYTSFPWLFSFGLISTLYIAALLVGKVYKDTYLTLLAAGSLMAYIGCVLAQYLFVELFPIKIVAAIGPIRFSIFGFWLLVLMYSYIIARYAPVVLLPCIREITRKQRTYLIVPIATATICFMYFVIGLQAKDSPLTTFASTHKSLTTWVATATEPNDVFAVPPSFPPTHVPLLLRRAVFTGNGFPFTEDGFVEHNARKALIFGLEEVKNKQFPGAHHLEKTILFYRNLIPKDFADATARYRLDYVVIEAEYAEAFALVRPVYSDHLYHIYKISDLYEASGPF